jgi:hypothetical protein
MSNFDAVLINLRQERDRISQAIAALEGVSGNGSRRALSGKRTISAAGRARIAAAQRARWAKVRGGKVALIAKKSPSVKRTMSPAARRRIAAAQRARWTAYRKQKKAA